MTVNQVKIIIFAGILRQKKIFANEEITVKLQIQQMKQDGECTELKSALKLYTLIVFCFYNLSHNITRNECIFMYFLIYWVEFVIVIEFFRVKNRILMFFVLLVCSK